jgi:hypothetical protein
MLYLYSTIQLSKYLPGGIWHFVGRFGIYRVNGMDNRESSISILVENLWLVSSALFFGAILSLCNPKIIAFAGFFPTNSYNGILIPVIILIWLAGNLCIYRYLLKGNAVIVNSLIATLIQGLVWLFFGLSFFVLLPYQYMNIGVSQVAMGGFSLGWALGYVTIFAPSGIGVREAVITAVMSIYMPPQEAVIYATLSRLVWVIAEICLGIFCELVFESGNLQRFFKNNQ